MTTNTANCSIDFVAQTITLSKKFARAARQYNSYEYSMLLNLTRDLPHFRIEIKQPTHKAYRPYQPTYREMERIITAFGNEDTMQKFRMVRECCKNYVTVLRWFKNRFPNAESPIECFECTAA